jgi:hypothetical protein
MSSRQASPSSSRAKLGEHGALYFQPSWIGNSNLLDIAEDDYTG